MTQMGDSVTFPSLPHREKGEGVRGGMKNHQFSEVEGGGGIFQLAVKGSQDQQAHTEQGWSEGKTTLLLICTVLMCILRICWTLSKYQNVRLTPKEMHPLRQRKP